MRAQDRRRRQRSQPRDAVQTTDAAAATRERGEGGGVRAAAADGDADGSCRDAGPALAAKPAPSRPSSPWLPALTPSEWLALAVLEIAAMGIYASTLYPSVAGGDSGELVAESCHLGVSHPPGYPLFNMLVHAWMKLTACALQESPAWSANLFSAACDTIAVGLIYLTIIGVSALPARVQEAKAGLEQPRWPAALSAASLFAFSPLTWTYAVSAEVFALNNAFASLLVFLLLVYEKRQRDLSSAVVGAFVCGLAMCNQHTIVLFELPIIAWVLYTRRRSIWTIRELGVLTGSFLAGLLPYAYMPLTSIWNPQPGSWGDVTTLAGFAHHIRRGDYGTFRLFSSNDKAEGLWTRLNLYALDLSTREVPFQLAFPMIAVGIWSSFRPQHSKTARIVHSRSVPSFAAMLVALFTFYMLVFHALSNLPLNERLLYGVHMRFWQQPNIIAFIWLGLGFQYVQDLVSRTQLRALPSIVGASWIVVGALQIALWHELMDQSRAYYIRDYGRALLGPLPKDSVLFVSFDLHWTALRYLQRCEQFRPDVTVLQLSMMTYKWFATKHKNYPNLVFPGSRLVPFGSQSDGFTMASLLDANLAHQRSPLPPEDRRVRFFLGGHLGYSDHDFNAKYWLVPYGLVDEFHLISKPPPSLQDWYRAQQPVMEAVHDALPALPPPRLYNDETWEWTIARNHGMKALSWSTYLLQKTIEEDPQNLTLLVESTHAMEASYQVEPQQFWNRAFTLKNLGLAYAQIVKSNIEFDDVDEDVFFNDAVGKSVGDWRRFKDRASARMLEVWHEWLQDPGAKSDPGYAAIESLVLKFLPDSKKQSDADAAAPRKQKKRKAAKNSRKKSRKPL